MKTRSLSLLTTFVCVLLAHAGAARAQDIVATSFEQMKMIARLGDDITITDASGHKVTGRLADLSRASLELLADGQHRSLTETDVMTISRHGHAKLSTGAKIGLGIGAALGAFAGMSITSDCRGCGVFVPMLAAVYGGLGAGIGVGIAALTPTQSVIFDSGASTRPH
jgi:hypothetical protein